MLVRTALYWLLAQALLIIVIASAAPGGASWLTLAGFVTPWYDDNFFALRLISVPWTDPRVWVSLQTLVQMLAVAMAAAAITTMARTNPWQHGVLPDSAPRGRDKPAGSPAPGGAPPGPGAGAGPMAGPAPGPPADAPRPPPPAGPAGV